MTEKVLFNYTDGFTGAVGDGSAPYTEEEFRGYNDAFLNGDNEDMGVVSRVSGELEVSTTILSPGSPDTVQVEAGRAIVHGFPYYSDAIENLGAPPGSGNRAGYVIIRMNRTSANSPPNEDEGRLRFLMSVDLTPPSFVQVSSTTWDIPLALFYVDGSDGAIYNDPSLSVSGTKGVIDYRRRVVTPLSQMLLIGIGGSFTSDVSAPITFDNIQPFYNNLRLVCSVRSTRAITSEDMEITFNNRVGGTDYLTQEHQFTNSGLTTIGAANSSSIGVAVVGDNAPTGVVSYVEVNIAGYAESTLKKSGQFKTVLQPTGAATAGWSVNTWWFDYAEAISRIDLDLGTGPDFKAGSRFYLYGY